MLPANILLCLLGCAAAAPTGMLILAVSASYRPPLSSVTTSAGILSSFKKAFGHERVDAHVDSDDELLHAVRRQWEVIEADSDADASSRHQYMACSSVSSAPSMLSVLSKHLDESNYHILLQSVTMDSTCYSVAGTLGEVAAISRDGARALRYAP